MKCKLVCCLQKCCIWKYVELSDSLLLTIDFSLLRAESSKPNLKSEKFYFHKCSMCILYGFYSLRFFIVLKQINYSYNYDTAKKFMIAKNRRFFFSFFAYIFWNMLFFSLMIYQVRVSQGVFAQQTWCINACELWLIRETDQAGRLKITCRR